MRSAAGPTAPSAPPGDGPCPAALSRDSLLAGEIKALALAGQMDSARERFGELVARQQRRAARIAFCYLRDSQDADEAVQDAFLKVFTHIASYRDGLPFEVWFTRILVNGCLDIRKAKARRLRWVLPLATEHAAQEPVATHVGAEARLVSQERVKEISEAVDQLPGRQRAVFTLCHIADMSTNEVSRALSLSEATVRVHLFRAVRRLRTLLAGSETLLAVTAPSRNDAAARRSTA